MELCRLRPDDLPHRLPPHAKVATNCFDRHLSREIRQTNFSDRLHNQHLELGLPNNQEACVDPYPRGPDWMPITPKTGSLFHADSHAIGRKLLTEDTSCEAVDMTAPETFTAASKQPLPTGRQWFGPGEICLRDSRRRRVWQDGGAQDASSSRRVNVFRKPAAVPCRHGSLERRTLLGED